MTIPATTTAAYQRPARGPVPARTKTDRFDHQIGFIARRFKFSVRNLSDAETQLLDDYARGASYNGEARHRLITFRRLCAIARRSRSPEDREALAELVRAECIDGVEPTPFEIAFDLETPVPGATDDAQRQFERNPTPISWRRCLDSLKRQETVTKIARFAVEHFGTVRGWT
jgi:hypothetical protein